MNAKPERNVTDASWTEWKEMCSIGNCKHQKTISELATFGRKRLYSALSKYDAQLAQYYCHEDESRAWLALEEFLYAGIGKRGKRAGKSYKDALLLAAKDEKHLEALISTQIRQELTRHLLHAEGYLHDQGKSIDGEKKNSWKRDTEEFTEVHEEVYIEPSEDDDSVRIAAEKQAAVVWDTLKRKPERILLACLVNNKMDMKVILESGIVTSGQSQLYNIRKKIIKTFETLEWPGCTETRQKAYMTRRTVPFLITKITTWLEKVENSEIKCFVYGEE